MLPATRLAAVKHGSAHVSRLRAAFTRFAPSLSASFVSVRLVLRRFCFICLICIALPLVLAAQRERPTQYDVEAVYLYQFGNFVQWPTPPSPKESFSICVMGRDPFARALDNTIAGESVGKAPLKDVHVDTIDDAKHCRILFISASENAHLDEILTRLGNSPVLTVSDVAGFIARGGMIEFLVQDNRVRFEINVGTATRAGLTMSSQLLKVAAAVRGAPAAGANQ